jgi:FkbM family methyltransferase
MTVYDVGANVGFYTLLFSRLVGPRGSVHAFEPAVRNLRFLRRHIDLNGVVNACVHESAVGAGSGVGTFNPGLGSSMGRLVAEHATTTIEVPLIALDHLVYAAGHAPPHLVKMDIEGGELDALHGMARILKEHRPTLLLATHGTARWRDCQELLSSMGYELRDLHGRPADTPDPQGELVSTPRVSGVHVDRGCQMTVNHA